MRAMVRCGLFGALAATGVMVGSQASYAAPAPAASPATVVSAAAKTQAGFVPVRTLADMPRAAVSPARGELWILEQGSPTKPVVLEHLRSGVWSSETLAAADGSFYSAALSGVARDDVWMSAVGTLRHYDGRRWSQVALPTAPDGTALVPGTLTSVTRGVVYVALSRTGATDAAWGQGAHIFRYDHGAWTDLGMPAGIPTGFGGGFYTTQIAVAGDVVSVISASYRQWQAFDYTGGAWSAGRQVALSGGGRYDSIGGYFVTAAGDHLLLGGFGAMGTHPGCKQWTAQTTGECTSTVVSGGAAKLANGSYVLGGNDYLDSVTHQSVQGTFALRDKNGVERPLAGDPGAQTLLVVAEGLQNAAWALTSDSVPGGSTTYRLQHYIG